MIALTLTDDYPDDDFPPFGSVLQDKNLFSDYRCWNEDVYGQEGIIEDFIWNSLIDMRKNTSDMLLVYVDGTYANSYVKIGSSSIPLSSLSSIQHLLKSTLIRGKEEENMFMSKYNSDILESFSEKHAAHIAHVVEANYSSEMFLQNLDILVILDLSTTNIENVEEIERKMLGQIGFYKNTATLVNLRPLGKKSKIAEELQNCLHRATYADFVNWTQILRQLQTQIPSIQVKGKITESNFTHKPNNTQKLDSLNTRVIVFTDSNEDWALNYSESFRLSNYKTEIVSFDNFSLKQEQANSNLTTINRISEESEYEEVLDSIGNDKNLIIVCLVTTTYAFNPMKFSTAWGSLKPAKVIDDCSHKVGNDCAKIIILDSLYKYTIERGMEVFSTAEVELNTYPSIAPLLTSLLPNAVYLFSRSKSIDSERSNVCSLFGINFRKIFQKRANLLNHFYLDDLSSELIQNHKITTVSGIIYQETLHKAIQLSQPTSIIRSLSRSAMLAYDGTCFVTNRIALTFLFINVFGTVTPFNITQ